MLAVTAEMGGSEDSHARLARHARKLWNDFAVDLEAASGRNIFFRESGSLLVAMDEGRSTVLSALASELAAKSEKVSWLDRDAARAEEPMLSESTTGALFAPGDAQVDNRALGEALAVAFADAGGQLRECCEVQHIASDEGGVRGVATSQGFIEADRVIVAAGAWSGRIPGVETAIAPVRPAKGQMAALTPPAGRDMPRHLVWGAEVYLVPREDSLLVGATVEDTGYETSVERDALRGLIANAVKLLPGLREWRVSESWAGLRPRTPDSLPVLGPTGIDGLYLASGQFRNGILFAPAIADAMRRMIFGGGAGPLFEAFDPRRFAS
jgi:glycine oxidase